VKSQDCKSDDQTPGQAQQDDSDAGKFDSALREHAAPDDVSN